VTNSVTTIDSWEGCFDEVIAPGAFRKTLRERTPKMQFDHGRHPLLGSLPLGVWTKAEEDDRGLHGVGRLSDNWLVTPFRDAIRDGGVEGMSFRFTVVREVWTDVNGKTIRDDELLQLLYYGAGERGPILRTLKDLSVSEMGPVVWPAYEETTVGVRSGEPRTLVIDLATLRKPEARAELARAVAMADAAAAHPGLDPELVTHAEFMRARDRLAVERNRPRPEDIVDTASTSSSTPASRSTDTADEHAAPAPPVTDTSAGDHPSALRSRVDRSAVLKRARATVSTMTKE
jgi:HK97 family phage prohead protease